MNSADKLKDKSDFKDKKSALMYFHTTFRNVGLFTTLSFGALGYSRYYRDRIQIYNLSLILIGLTLILVAFLINFYLYNDMVTFLKENEDKETERMLVLNKIVFFIHFILFLLGITTLFRNLNK